MKESFRSDFGLYRGDALPFDYGFDLNSTNSTYPTNSTNHINPTTFDTLGNMSFGTGSIGDIRQDIGHSIRPGFGRETGSFYPRSVRRRFNIEFQRGSYNKCKTGINEYMYECGMPSSYYPMTYVNSYPYSKNYDPYPYHEDDIGEFCEKRQLKLIRTYKDNSSKLTLLQTYMQSLPHPSSKNLDTINVILLLFIILVSSWYFN